MLIDEHAVPRIASGIGGFQCVAVRRKYTLLFQFRITDKPQLRRIKTLADFCADRIGSASRVLFSVCTVFPKCAMQLCRVLGHPQLTYFDELCDFRICFLQRAQMVRLCGMHGCFIQDDDVFSEIGLQFGIAPKKTVGDFPALSDEVAIVDRKLFVFARIVADDDQFDFILSGNVVERTVVHDRRFNGIIRRILLRGGSLQRFERRSVLRPLGNARSEFVTEFDKGFKLRSKHHRTPRLSGKYYCAVFRNRKNETILIIP